MAERSFNCTHCYDTGRKFSDCHHCASLGYVNVAAFTQVYLCECSNLRCVKCGKAGPNGLPVVSYPAKKATHLSVVQDNPS